MSQRPIGTNGWQKEIIMKFIRSVGTVGAMQEESGLYLAIGNYFKKVFAAATDRENL